jgi:hypothetical protein
MLESLLNRGKGILIPQIFLRLNYVGYAAILTFDVHGDRSD